MWWLEWVLRECGGCLWHVLKLALWGWLCFFCTELVLKWCGELFCPVLEWGLEVFEEFLGEFFELLIALEVLGELFGPLLKLGWVLELCGWFFWLVFWLEWGFDVCGELFGPAVVDLVWCCEEYCCLELEWKEMRYFKQHQEVKLCHV